MEPSIAFLNAPSNESNSNSTSESIDSVVLPLNPLCTMVNESQQSVARGLANAGRGVGHGGRGVVAIERGVVAGGRGVPTTRRGTASAGHGVGRGDAAAGRDAANWGRGGRGAGHGNGAPAELVCEKFHLKDEHYALMLEWLEILENFQMLNGGGNNQGRIGHVHTKKVVFDRMLVTLHAWGFPKFVKTKDNL